jgi:hypothetical protein
MPDMGFESGYSSTQSQFLLMGRWIDFANLSVDAVFVMFGLFALMGAVVAFFFAVETRTQILERVSPV